MKTPWIDEARLHLGKREIPGKDTAPFIKKMLGALRVWWDDDETPWCGVFAGYCMKVAGVPYPKAFYRAKAWLDWGVPVSRPVYGCVVVFTRKGGGHVGFVIGQDEIGRLIVRGGNQGNMVSDAPFDKARVAGYRVPEGATGFIRPPLIRSDMKSSRDES